MGMGRGTSVEEILKQILDSQKDIQKTLQQHGQILEHHNKMMGQQDKRLELQNKRLEQHGDSLEQQGKRLKQLGKRLEHQGDILAQQGDILQQHSKQLNCLQKGQVRLEGQMDSLENNHLKLENRIENEIIEKIRALYDARSVQNDINTKIIDTLDRIETKIDCLQMETAHIGKVKTKRSL